MTLYEYEKDKRTDEMLFYDDSFQKDVQVRFVIKNDDSRWIALVQEPDAPFATSFVREMIPEDQFEVREINSKTIRQWLDEKEIR